MFHPIDDCEHPPLYLPGTGKALQETAISGLLQQNLAGICNSVCVWWLIEIYFKDLFIFMCMYTVLSTDTPEEGVRSC